MPELSRHHLDCQLESLEQALGHSGEILLTELSRLVWSMAAISVAVPEAAVPVVVLAVSTAVLGKHWLRWNNLFVGLSVLCC
jgi:hypothetical protein